MGVMGATAIIQALAGSPGDASSENLPKEKYRQVMGISRPIYVEPFAACVTEGPMLP